MTPVPGGEPQHVEQKTGDTLKISISPRDDVVHLQYQGNNETGPSNLLLYEHKKITPYRDAHRLSVVDNDSLSVQIQLGNLTKSDEGLYLVRVSDYEKLVKKINLTVNDVKASSPWLSDAPSMVSSIMYTVPSKKTSFEERNRLWLLLGVCCCICGPIFLVYLCNVRKWIRRKKSLLPSSSTAEAPESTVL
ncbi:uncharacterized protein LOC106707051 [Latimeria chalumnae]|uniref:uncharacterized protein LOC106707051 n=1 Tax=Latimeria chalumnae TaxID=7897 RepID=UPI0006D92B82|nr:PREDICTED: uncharacterized protein LOC106707051 isoform X2 [Latimeria chalumnae]XP_014354290.1 PREDICTED: uncharacterized protein LOC106707051 isoform X2 [Latimeria chalumnae]|eukprot:XP_014354289.1 PREDICTED: uncharacterized protein LOC106707051 isoform X2 [Latimeria chalumnae]